MRSLWDGRSRVAATSTPRPSPLLQQFCIYGPHLSYETGHKPHACIDSDVLFVTGFRRERVADMNQTATKLSSV